MPEKRKKKRIEENKLTIVSATEVETIHIPQSEARNLYDSTVPIWNMTGEYMIGVEVFHQLHCLVSFLYKISESSPHIISNGWFRTLSWWLDLRLLTTKGEGDCVSFSFFFFFQDTIRKAAWPERYNHTFFFPNGTRDDFFTRHFGKCPHKKKQIYSNHHNCMQMLWSRRQKN